MNSLLLGAAVGVLLGAVGLVATIMFALWLLPDVSEFEDD